MTKNIRAASPTTQSNGEQKGEVRTRKGPRGLGAMRHVHLNIDPRIDLTQPIYEQVLALQKADKEAAEKEAASKA